uniref:Uncharacterized protein n=1 Tax=Ustilago esculenta TaxID=185366 RepID=A0A481SFM8_9BASI|nr:hypothetical protein UE_1422 [Ustilago esculenta]
MDSTTSHAQMFPIGGNPAFTQPIPFSIGCGMLLLSATSMSEG